MGIRRAATEPRRKAFTMSPTSDANGKRSEISQALGRVEPKVNPKGKHDATISRRTCHAAGKKALPRADGQYFCARVVKSDDAELAEPKGVY
jgi:hypothetical protein